MKTSKLLCAAGAGCVVIAGAVAAPPVNDNMANAMQLSAGTYSFNTTEATTDGPSYSCESGAVSLGKDVWYWIRTVAGGAVTVDTCGTQFDTTVIVYKGLTATTSVGCNDERAHDTCGNTHASRFVFAAEANTTYLINVGGYVGLSGPGFITVSGPLVPLPTFTYQGQIKSNAVLVNGPLDMTFKIFDSETGGTQIGATQIRNGVPVSNGVFSVELTFDAGGLPATVLYVEVSVNGTALSRQKMTSVPRAAEALRVPWDGISGMPAAVANLFAPWEKSGNDILFTGGRVGVGTAPSVPLHVASSVYTVEQLDSPHGAGTWLTLNNTSAGGTYWHLISSGSGNGEGAGKLLIGPSGSATTSNTMMTLQSNGNVGIGTFAPSQRLTVNGNVLANNVGVPSSIRFKDHVVPLEGALESLMKLEGVRFDWKPEFAKERGFTSDVGFVAEDVAKVFPEIVLKDAEGNVIGMDYSRVTAVAVEAIKQLKREQENEIKRLREEKDREIGELRGRLERLERAK